MVVVEGRELVLQVIVKFSLLASGGVGTVAGLQSVFNLVCDNQEVCRTRGMNS